MSGILKRPKLPDMPAAIPQPTTDDARQAEEDVMRVRRRRGLASTFLAGRTSRGSASSSLLGAGGGGGRPAPGMPGPSQSGPEL